MWHHKDIISFYCASQMLCFFKLKVCGNPVSSKSFSPVFLTAFAHFVSLCYILVILTIFQTFSLLFICYGDLWSVIFDVTIILVFGHHKQCPKMVNLIDKSCVCSDCSADWPFPHLSLLGPLYPLRHKNIEVNPINNPTVASKCSSEGRITCLSF